MEIDRTPLTIHNTSHNSTGNVIKKFSSNKKAFQMYNKLKYFQAKLLKNLEIRENGSNKIDKPEESFQSYMKISIAKPKRSPKPPNTLSLESAHTLSEILEKKSKSLKSRQMPCTLNDFLQFNDFTKNSENSQKIYQKLSKLIDNLKIKRQMKCVELISLFPITIKSYEDEIMASMGSISVFKTDKSFTPENNWELECAVHNLCQIIKWLSIYLDVSLPYPILFGQSHKLEESKSTNNPKLAPDKSQVPTIDINNTFKSKLSSLVIDFSLISIQRSFSNLLDATNTNLNTSESFVSSPVANTHHLGNKIQNLKPNSGHVDDISSGIELLNTYSPSFKHMESLKRKGSNNSFASSDGVELENDHFHSNIQTSANWFHKFTNNLLSRTFWKSISSHMKQINYENVDKNADFNQEETKVSLFNEERIRGTTIKGSTQATKNLAHSIQIVDRLSGINWKFSVLEANKSSNFQDLMKYLDDNLYELCLRQGYYTNTIRKDRTLKSLIGLLNHTDLGCFVPKSHKIFPSKSSEDSDNDWIII